MRVDILAIGSRGDVQPYVALGLGLRSAGHCVRIVTLGGFEDLVRGRGLDHLVIGESPQAIANTEAGREWVQKRASAAGFLRGFARVANTLIEAGIAAYWQACRNTELIVASPMGILVGAHLAEKLQIPVIQAQLAPPVFPTRYDWDGRKSLSAAVRGRLTASIDSTFRLIMWLALRRSTNEARRNVLDLPPLSLAEPVLATRRKQFLLLAGYSPAVAAPLPDWGDWVHVTGYWFLEDPPWEPPPDLVDFLHDGPRPVFIGFGSTPFPNPEATTEMVIRAIARAERRAILVAGGSGLATGRLSDRVLSIESVPHGWLFPQVGAAVHHGGAGVTGAALHAGLPSVVVPVFADQPFWGKRVFELGAGPQPIPANHLTEDALVAAIRATANPEMQERAAALGKRIRAEDGIARAVEMIHQYTGADHLNAGRQQHAH